MKPGNNHFAILIALAPGLIAAAWLVSKAQWFWSHRPDLNFGWLVLMLSAFLLWEAWEKKPVPVFRLGFLNALLAVGGLSLLFIVQIYQAALGMMAASLSGLAIGVACIVMANLLYVFGWPGVRTFAFGFLFLYIALPLPSAVHGLVVNGLQGVVASINVEVLNLIGIPAQQVGSLIRLPNGTVGIDEACSGIRSLQSTIMATLFIGYLTLKSKGLQGALFVCGIGLAIFGNLLRSLFLSYMANSRGVKSVETFHDSAGWSILAFTAVGVILLAWLFNKLERSLSTSPSPVETVSEPAGRAD